MRVSGSYSCAAQWRAYKPPSEFPTSETVRSDALYARATAWISSATRRAPFGTPSNDRAARLHPGFSTSADDPARLRTPRSRHDKSSGVPPRPCTRTKRCVGPAAAVRSSSEDVVPSDEGLDDDPSQDAAPMPSSRRFSPSPTPRASVERGDNDASGPDPGPRDGVAKPPAVFASARSAAFKRSRRGERRAFVRADASFHAPGECPGTPALRRRDFPKAERESWSPIAHANAFPALCASDMAVALSTGNRVATHRNARDAMDIRVRRRRKRAGELRRRRFARRSRTTRPSDFFADEHKK